MQALCRSARASNVVLNFKLMAVGNRRAKKNRARTVEYLTESVITRHDSFSPQVCHPTFVLNLLSHLSLFCQE